MAGYIVAPNPITASGLSSQVTVGTSSVLKDPIPIPYAAFDNGTPVTITAAGGTTQLLRTSARTFAAGTYLVWLEVDISSVVAYGSTDNFLVGIGTTGGASMSPNANVPFSPGTNLLASTTISGILTFAAATDTITLSITVYAATTTKSITWSGFTYQKIA